ncbi:DNA helicase B [Astyanax mexicanus]|uniref:DNA helicase B n=1 Tax=Astyanax mexicanus TaxID=7994 RepID=UPI0020CABD0B|nr:DNA helicase B [Astyanax mexicanus]
MAPPHTLVGYILPDKEEDRVRNEDSESEDEEEERQPEFLDMKEMDSVSCGGFMLQSSVPPLTEVDFMTSKQKYRIQGRFALRDPWWEISCSASRLNSKFVMKGYPSYSLRILRQEEGRSIVSLFLKACGVDSDFVTRFMQWLPVDRHVDLTNVEEALNDFGNQSKENGEQVESDVLHRISKSDAGFYVRAARMYPHVMRYMPTLLPGKFLKLLNKEKEVEIQKRSENTEDTLDTQETADVQGLPEKQKDESILAKLENLIKTTVWKLGFGYIMWKEFQLVRCETRVEAFRDCKLFSTIPRLQRDALVLYDDLKNFCRQKGHTYIDRENLQESMRSCGIPEVNTWEAVNFLRNQGVLKVDKQKIALRNLYKYETEIVECLSTVAMAEPWKIDLDVKEVLSSAQRMRMRAKAELEKEQSSSAQNGEEHAPLEPLPVLDSSLDFDDSFDEEFDPTPVELDPDQVRAAEMMCANPVTVISGKGGCGKTTVVSLIFKAAVAQQESKKEKELEINSSCEGNKENGAQSPQEVLLTAPTGRAASLLTKRTSFTAYTMHQVLWSFMSTKKSPSGEPMNWMFAKVRVLVVDEGSLVCVQILHSLLSMLTKYAKLQKFILLGDIRQLPSIDPGNTLNDLFESLQRVRWAIEMRTNHRAESELIVRNAGLIADMGLKKTYYDLDFDEVVDLSETFRVPSPDKRFILILLPREENDDDLQMAIKQLLQRPAPGLKDDRSSQFVAFMRRDCDLINELCCKHYSDHTTKDCKKKLNFQVGDKVCCTKNGYVTDIDKEKEIKDMEKDTKEMQKKEQAKDTAQTQENEQVKDTTETQKNKQAKTRLCNGQIFFIKEDRTVEDAGKRGSKRRQLLLADETGEVVLKADYRELQRECKLRHAWARTIHTFQGSEEKTVVYVVGNGICQTWKHVYTAVTRGQQRVYVVAKIGGLERAIRGHVIKRSTRLAGLLTDMIGKLKQTRDDLYTQTSQSYLGTPKRGSSILPGQSTLWSSPGPSQAFCSTKSKYAEQVCTHNTAEDMIYGNNTFQSGSPSVSKRHNKSDNCDTPTKQQKTAAVESPLGCSQLERLSLASSTPKAHARKLFPGAPQITEDQPQ